MNAKNRLRRAADSYISDCSKSLDRLVEACSKSLDRLVEACWETNEEDCNAPSAGDMCRNCKRCIRTRIRENLP